MRTTSLIKFIESNHFFKNMTPELLKEIEACASSKHFKKDDYISKEGSHADSFYLLQSGSVNIETEIPLKGKTVVQTLHEGDILGWSWAFPPYIWQFDCKATDSIQCIEFHGQCLRAKCEENHELGYLIMKQFAKIMTNRLQATRFQLLDVFASPDKDGEL